MGTIFSEHPSAPIFNKIISKNKDNILKDSDLILEMIFKNYF
jgi:hypothetical protein